MPKTFLHYLSYCYCNTIFWQLSNFSQKRSQVRKFTRQDFNYQEASDHYLCPQGKILRRISKRSFNRGHIYRRYRAQEQDCQVCPLRSRCLYGARAKRKDLSVPVDSSLTKQMVDRIETPLGRKIYPLRLAIAEPVFANIRSNKKLDRFTLRGKDKVNIQWLIYCLVHNIEKIRNYGNA